MSLIVGFLLRSTLLTYFVSDDKSDREMLAALQLITSPTQLHFLGHTELHSLSSSPFLQCTTLSHTCPIGMHCLLEEHLNFPAHGTYEASKRNTDYGCFTEKYKL
jgi:hypothetical protein